MNPQNTIASSPQPNNRYSKISIGSNNTGNGGDIGEETHRNQVNETRTIKDKLGHSKILTPPIHNLGKPLVLHNVLDS